jgi:hypothetical protein
MSEGQGKTKPPAWDVTKAWEDYQAARKANDPEAEILAMRRWGEAQTNASIGLLEQVVRPLAEQIANARAADLDWRTEERLRRDKQADRLYDELDQLASAVRESSARLGKFQEELEGLRQGQRDYTARLNEIDVRHGAQWEESMTLHRDLAARLDADEQRLRAKREELDLIQAWRLQVDAFMADIQSRIDRALPEEETQYLIALLRQIAAERGSNGQ